MADSLPYVGEELDIFAHARNWKDYWSTFLRPYIQGNVLEVGAGIGTNTVLLRNFTQGEWTCLEPDTQLLDRLARFCDPRKWNIKCVAGILANLPADQRFDTIMYIDVLEHIEHDAGELKVAAAHLKPNGRVIVLSPAHPWLYTDFDKAIGHFRRYTKATMRQAGTGLDLRLEKLVYLDSAGLLASCGNAMLLRKSKPTVNQILFWDRMLVPISRILDIPLCRMIGKTVVGVWRKP